MEPLTRALIELARYDAGLSADGGFAALRDAAMGVVCHPGWHDEPDRRADHYTRLRASALPAPTARAVWLLRHRPGMTPCESCLTRGGDPDQIPAGLTHGASLIDGLCWACAGAKVRARHPDWDGREILIIAADIAVA